MKKLRNLIILGLMGMMSLSACTPEEIAVFKTLDPTEQQAVITHLQDVATPPPSNDCYDAVNQLWPSSSISTAKKAVRLESTNNRFAQNSGSSAKGCFQIMHSYHAQKYYQVGCTPSQWSNANCNTKVALILYNQSGWSPWNASLA